MDRLREVVKESELQFLKSQINPHFLFNNLNNLYSYALEGSPKTPEIILELSGLLRYMLYECRQEFVPFYKEKEQLKNFVNLNELQIEDRGIVNLDLGSTTNDYQIAPLILIVFVENAFKHSQNSLSDKIAIDISIQVSDGGKLHFTCENSYGDVENEIDVDHGIGLENVKKRLNLIYPDRHTLNIVKKNATYKVDLYIDLELSGKI